MSFVVEPVDDSLTTPSDDSSLPTGEGIVLDIGTGDGLFVYRRARENPRKFFIGIDANPRPLEKVSEKIHRKESKGGLRTSFSPGSVEDLPLELNGRCGRSTHSLPWGSLLRAVAVGEEAVLRNLRRVCAAGALLEVVLGLDADRDRFEMERLGLPLMTATHVNSVLVPRYENAASGAGSGHAASVGMVSAAHHLGKAAEGERQPDARLHHCAGRRVKEHRPQGESSERPNSRRETQSVSILRHRIGQACNVSPSASHLKAAVKYRKRPQTALRFSYQQYNL